MTPAQATPLPYWRLSGFYFWYYAALGAFTPYFARWVHDSGHGAFAASATMALWYGTRIVAPPAWSIACARSPAPLRWLRGGAVAAAVAFAGFLLFDGLIAVLLTMAVFSFFANAIMPQFEAITLERLGARRSEYGRIRVWGSIGFLMVAAGFGPLLDVVGSEWLPALMLPLLAAVAASTLPVTPAPPVAPAHDPAVHLSLRDVVRRRDVLAFLVIALLVQIGFGPFYVFFTIHLGEFGHGGRALGLLWAVGVLAEIGMFMLMPRVLRLIDARTAILVCVAVTVARWLAVALWPASLPLMLAAQLLHALSFGAFHAACMHRIGKFFPGRLAQHGQSLLYGFSSGVGGVLGALLAGAAWEIGRGHDAFVFGALVSLAATALAAWTVVRKA